MFRFGISVCICYTENQLLKKKRTNNEMTILHNILARDIFSSLLDTRRSYSTYLQKINECKKIWEKTQWQVYSFHVDKQCYRQTSIDLESFSIFITLCPLYLNLCRDKNKVNNKITGCLLPEWNTWNHLSVLINITFWQEGDTVFSIADNRTRVLYKQLT